MLASIISNPLVTFFAGIVLSLAGIILLLSSCAAPNNSAAEVAAYRQKVTQATPGALVVGSQEEKAAIERFTNFLQSIGDVESVKKNTRKVYAENAYLDDTLAVHQGAAEIEAYFVKTSEVMTQYKVDIEDVAKSGTDYYIRWNMEFSAPALSGGKSVHSIGISQVRFNGAGQVIIHQDFWDSGKNFYAHLPVVGGGIGLVRKKMNSN